MTGVQTCALPIYKFRNRANNPCHPHLMGSAEQPETFFQHNEARNKSYDESIDIIKGVMDQVNKCIGTDYKPFNYYGAPDATDVIVAMGSVCETVAEVVDYLNKNDDRKVGLIKVRLFRPFSSAMIVRAPSPERVTSVTIGDRPVINCGTPRRVSRPVLRAASAWCSPGRGRRRRDRRAPPGT